MKVPKAKKRLDQFKAQDLANMVWAFATVGQQEEQLFKSLAKMAEWRLDQFKAQELANMAWAFARVGQQDQQLFHVVAKMAERRVDQFNAQDLDNMAWALTDSAAKHARELVKRSSRGASWGGWVIIVFGTAG